LTIDTNILQGAKGTVIAGGIVGHHRVQAKVRIFVANVIGASVTIGATARDPTAAFSVTADSCHRTKRTVFTGSAVGRRAGLAVILNLITNVYGTGIAIGTVSKHRRGANTTDAGIIDATKFAVVTLEAIFGRRMIATTVGLITNVQGTGIGIQAFFGRTATASAISTCLPVGAKHAIVTGFTIV